MPRVKNVLCGPSVHPDFDEYDFVEKVYSSEYVLVVGSSVILDRRQPEFSGCNGDVNKYIIDQINADRRAVRHDFQDHTSFDEVYRGTSPSEGDPIYDLLADEIEYTVDDMSEELVALLRSKLFRFVLTTTVDGYMETLMRSIWGESLEVVSIYDSISDFQTKVRHAHLHNTPILVYVFGRVQKGKKNKKHFVKTDNDAIKVIERWIKVGSADNPFWDMLKDKHILSLGCKFDDWYFRFFWHYILKGDLEFRGDGDSKCHRIAASFDSSDRSDKQLKNHFSHLGVCLDCGDIWEFMSHLHGVLLPKDSSSPFFDKVIKEKLSRGQIFISYKSKDFHVVLNLFCRLNKEDENFNIWFDYDRLMGGDPYDDVIRTAISEADLFLPILSENIVNDLNCSKLDEYYQKEWRWASEFNVPVIPVTIDGWNKRGPEQVAFEEIMKRKPVTVVDLKDRENAYSFLKESICCQLRK